MLPMVGRVVIVPPSVQRRWESSRVAAGKKRTKMPPPLVAEPPEIVKPESVAVTPPSTWNTPTALLPLIDDVPRRGLRSPPARPIRSAPACWTG